VENIEERAMRRAMWRLVPLLCLCYFIAYLDRVNAGFAKLQMNTSLGLDDSMFGLGAGLFFIAYFLLGVPSNLALDRVGARRWIACIMLLWGAISACFAFLQPIGHAIGLSNEYAFYLFRFLLGMAEAGFFPGVVLFLTLWFPALYRARIIGLFTLAAPFSSMLGAPLSGALLNVTGSGLAGWQWLFLLEGVPAILMAFVVWGYLTDGPDKAAWLAVDERQWLIAHLDSEHDRKEKAGRPGFLKTISDPRILALAAGVFLARRHELWHQLLLADYRQGLWTFEFPYRYRHCSPICFRSGRHAAADTPFRQDWRAQAACGICIVPDRAWRGDVGAV
jgi:ACS family tartrate transporter-like MFS transporter